MAESNTIDVLEQLPYPWQESLWQELSSRFNNQQLAHSLLVSGVSGLGKMDFLTHFSRLMLCKAPEQGRACGNCANCKQGGREFHPDILHIGAEEGSKEIKVDQIRALSEFAHKSSHSGACKVVIIRDAHRLNVNAANALLKTLEEPSADTFIFLASDFPGRLLPTIRSRCQSVKFPTADKVQAKAWLQAQLGESDRGSIEELLEASDNRPLYALQLAEEGELQSLGDFLKMLLKLKAGAASLQAVITLAMKIGDAKALHYLSLSSTALIKNLISSRSSDEPVLKSDADSTAKHENSAISEFCSTVNCTQSKLKPALQELLVFDVELNKARKQLQSTTNPNPQLLIESIIWQWNKLPLSVDEQSPFSACSSGDALSNCNCILDVRISNSATLSKCWIPFFRNGGLFIPSRRNLDIGSNVFVLLRLPDENQVWPLLCKVALVNKSELDGNRLAGVGLQILTVNQKLSERLNSCRAKAPTELRPIW